jgi:hypothetical protein
MLLSVVKKPVSPDNNFLANISIRVESYSSINMYIYPYKTLVAHDNRQVLYPAVRS